MATVHGPQLARHASPFRRTFKGTTKPQAHHHSHHSHSATTSQPDTYYGHEETAKLCSRFVSHTFNCPEVLPSNPHTGSIATSTSAPSAPTVPPTLAHFVAYALHRTRLHQSVTFTSLALLHRLKIRFPAARGSSGHRLFLSAFMISSKVVCDDTYSNKSWAVVGQGMFALREINQMEREMCAYLDWELNVAEEDLVRFEKEVRRVYGVPGPYTMGISISIAPGIVRVQQEEEKSQGSAGRIEHAHHSDESASQEFLTQLPTPTEHGPAAMPLPFKTKPSPPRAVASTKKPILAPISTGSGALYSAPVASVYAHHPAPATHRSSSGSSHPYPSPPGTPDSSSSGSSRCTRGDLTTDSPSPTSTDSSALPTPPSTGDADSVSHAALKFASVADKSKYTLPPLHGMSVPPVHVHFMHGSTSASAAPVIRTKGSNSSVASRVSVPMDASYAGLRGVAVDDELSLDDERSGVAYHTQSTAERSGKSAAKLPAAPVPVPVAPPAVAQRGPAKAASSRDFPSMGFVSTSGRERDSSGRAVGKTFTVACQW